MSTGPQSSGVEELIQLLRQQGVEEGKNEAELLLEQARLRAQERLDTANREAEEILRKALEDARQEREAGQEAVRLAVRDAILQLKTNLVEQFADRVRRLVSRQLHDQELLKQIILEVAGRAAPANGKAMRIFLPEDVVGLEQLRRDPEQVKEGTLSHFVLNVTQELLRDGIEFGTRDDALAGIRLKLTEEDLEIELTEEAVSELLLRHLAPRFRAMMEGIIQ